MTVQVFLRWVRLATVAAEFATRLALKDRLELSLKTFPDILQARRSRLDFAEKKEVRQRVRETQASPSISVALGGLYVAPGAIFYAAQPAAPGTPPSPAMQTAPHPMDMAEMLGRVLATASPKEREALIRRMSAAGPTETTRPSSSQ